MVQMTTTILNDFAKTIMSVFDEQLNGEILHSYIVKFYYHMENLFIPVINLLNLQVCVNVLTKVSDFPNRSCVLNFCTKWPGVCVPDVEVSGDEDKFLTFILAVVLCTISSYLIMTKPILH